MSIRVLILAAFAILLSVDTAAGQTRRGGGPGEHRNLRLEVVTLPEKVQAGLKDLSKQVLLYHPVKKPKGKSPLIIFLHGSGGTKRDISSFKWKRDVKQFLKLADEKHVARILVPQSRSHWHPGSLNKLLDHILETHPDIDQDRIYCIGYSMGGKGTWEWAMSSPKRFAAIIPMAFIADTSRLESMKHLPIWAFVGSKDRRRARSVPKMAKTLEELGSTVIRMTVFEGANHAATDDKAWAQEGLLDWLFAQSRKKPVSRKPVGKKAKPKDPTR
jgi:predicted peptidase